MRTGDIDQRILERINSASVIRAPPWNGIIRKKYNEKTFKKLTKAHICLGVLAIVLQGADLIGHNWYWYDHNLFAGFWSGLLFIMSGIMGIVSYRTLNIYPTAVFAILSGLSSICTLGMIVQAISITTFVCWFCHMAIRDVMSLIVAALYFIIAGAEILVGIASTVYVCKAVTCCTTPEEGEQWRIQHTQNAQGQMLIVLVPGAQTQDGTMEANDDESSDVPLLQAEA